ncbi:MAG: pyruvate, phosphate dikinase [Chloroflexota bacterium]|nr:pyruvate, phosphate dikinase [Chloroflexota bacterium]
MATTATRWVYLFRDGDAGQRDLLGGKGANLAEMTNAGLPVPPGFTITTEACNAYFAVGGTLPDGLWEQTLDGLKEVERQMGRTFGGDANPLLVSVRSGAKFSMPGMMDTILNLGLSPTSLAGLIAETGDPRFAYDCMRRLIQMFGKVVLDVDSEQFEDALDRVKRRLNVSSDTEIPADALKALADEFRAIVRKESGVDFPDDPLDQLKMAIEAVFRSWNNQRAIRYRRQNNIPDDLGTAVNVQSMVYGNLGDDCATGVCFTRNPNTGAPGLFGEYLPNAQGEDVVAGVRTPKPVREMGDDPALREAFTQLVGIAERLERHYRDMQDLEFTIQHHELFMLQTRNGKRTGAAAVKIAVDLANEGLISEREAVRRVEPAQLDQLLHPTIDPGARVQVLATGLPASPGAATGKVVFDPDEAQRRGQAGEPVILVRIETSPEDFHGMVAAQGVLTARGGMTSHAAVVARGMGKPCVSGCTALQIDYGKGEVHVAEFTFRIGDFITIDGATGNVLLGKVPTVEPTVGGDLATLMGWADTERRLKVRANADTPQDAAAAREFGAEGIGLCRTEHMFFQGNRIDAMRAMILATSLEEREKALAEIEPLQREDFLGIFRAMDGYPVTIRTLDPPLHEFLPNTPEEQADLAAKLGIPVQMVRDKVNALHEANPMLGFRGCRLGIQYPEITRMQARAIIEAALAATQEGIQVEPEIMIPLVSTVEELKRQRALIAETIEAIFAEAGARVPYTIGTMIELPRAALIADEIAAQADFFSFGTNDLTQTTFGLSRDDAGRFLPLYVDRGILPADPFQVLDQEGVGKLVEMGTRLGRQTKPGLKVGICGEHGGEPSSVAFCERIGLDYVSCSPFRVPIARLAAAQAVIAGSDSDR